MLKQPITALVYAGALQLMLTIINVYLYSRPWTWATKSLSYWSNHHCGSNIQRFKAQLDSHAENARLYHISLEAYKQHYAEWQRDCGPESLDRFTDTFRQYCMTYTKSSYHFTPIASCILIGAIIWAIQYSSKVKLLKQVFEKSGVVIAFLFSLILTGLNIGQFVAILVPIWNSDARVQKSSYGALDEFNRQCQSDVDYFAICSSGISMIISGFITIDLGCVYRKRAEILDTELVKIETENGKNDVIYSTPYDNSFSDSQEIIDEKSPAEVQRTFGHGHGFNQQAATFAHGFNQQEHSRESGNNGEGW